MQSSTQELQRVGLARLRELGTSFIIGVDECGYGAWAGPVTVCAAVARADWSHPRVKDSKKMEKREHVLVVRDVLVASVIPTYSIRNHSSFTIDKIGLHVARDQLVLEAVRHVRKEVPDALAVMDGNQLPKGLHNALCFPKADGLVGAVAAASILAKADRDELMRFFHEDYPQYGFDTNAGYRSPKHVAALETLGPTPIHRFSFSNIREYAGGGSQTAPRPATISRWQRPPVGMRASTSSNKR